MTDKKSDAQRVLERIAGALGTDVSDLYGGSGLDPQRAREVLELLRAFEGIDDPDDRRACLDFVRSVAARKPGP